MAKQDYSVLGGMRDFTPEMIKKRYYIFDTIKNIFTSFGFVPIETPSIERLAVLTGKYGEEGDKLLFNVFNSGSAEDFKEGKLQVDKALRYDLTVPFARFVSQNQSQLPTPFKRYQIQNVWRGDRPQKGRYREFTQCDADVVGSASLLNEAELIQIYRTVFIALGFPHFTIHINNRKILNGIVEVLGKPDLFQPICIAIDKWDKIGAKGVQEELLKRGLNEQEAQKLIEIIGFEGTIEDVLAFLANIFQHSEIGKSGVEELSQTLEIVKLMTDSLAHLKINLTLARGLDYYTGAIFEVTIDNVAIGSVGGGGRYDNLTESFGGREMTGVGISFGADRIYDALTELNLFPNLNIYGTKILLLNTEAEAFPVILKIAHQLRQAQIPCEIFHQLSRKVDKQFAYAEKKQIPYIITIGNNEINKQQAKVKNIAEGTQIEIPLEQLVSEITKLINSSNF